MSVHSDISDIEELSKTLSAMTGLLRSHDLKFWADELDRCQKIIDQSDFFGVERLLRFYGGMGSLNDVILQGSSIFIWLDNRKFDRLRRRAYDKATALAREQPLISRRQP